VRGLPTDYRCEARSETWECLVDLNTLFRTIGRRWYVALPVALVFGLLAIAIVNSSNPDYRAEASVVVVRTGFVPPEQAIPTGDEVQLIDDLLPIPKNPFEEFSSSVGVTARVLEEAAVSQPFRRQIASEGLQPEYDIAVDEEAPILVIEVTAASPTVAIETVNRVVELIGLDLESRQNRFDVPADRRMVVDAVATVDRAVRVDTTRNRALVGLVVLGLIAVAVAALIEDGIARSRSRRSAARRDDDATEAVETSDPQPPVGDDWDEELDRWVFAGVDPNGISRDDDASTSVEMASTSVEMASTIAEPDDDAEVDDSESDEADDSIWSGRRWWRARSNGSDDEIGSSRSDRVAESSVGAGAIDLSSLEGLDFDLDSADDRALFDPDGFDDERPDDARFDDAQLDDDGSDVDGSDDSDDDGRFDDDGSDVDGSDDSDDDGRFDDDAASEVNAESLASEPEPERTE